MQNAKYEIFIISYRNITTSTFLLKAHRVIIYNGYKLHIYQRIAYLSRIYIVVKYLQKSNRIDLFKPR